MYIYEKTYKNGNGQINFIRKTLLKCFDSFQNLLRMPIISCGRSWGSLTVTRRLSADEYRQFYDALSDSGGDAVPMRQCADFPRQLQTG